jgi:chemotaxis protein CheX
MERARKVVPTTSSHFDGNFIDAFINGVTLTFEMMAKTTLIAGPPVIETKLPQHGDVVGFVGLTGSTTQGMVLVSFDKDVLLFFLEKLFGQVYTEINDEACDAVGELTNIIYGGAKTILNNLGYRFEMAVPSVVMGATRFSINASDQCLSLPFSCQKGKFVLSIVLGEKQEFKSPIEAN